MKHTTNVRTLTFVALLGAVSASLIYRRIHTKKGAVISLTVSSVFVSIIFVFINMYIAFPMYVRLYGMPMEAIRGRLEPRSHAAMGGNYSLPGFEVIGSTAVLRVNKYGKRYSNEGFGTHILGALAGAKQPNGMLYGIFDSDIREEMTYQTPCHAVVDYCEETRMQKLDYQLREARKAGEKGLPIGAIKGSEKPGYFRILYAADSIEELAEYMYEDDRTRKTFIATVERYNEMCRQKQDVDFGKEPIQGLFATGNCSGCRFGFQYTTSMPGQSISIAQTLGREAGRYVAALV